MYLAAAATLLATGTLTAQVWISHLGKTALGRAERRATFLIGSTVLLMPVAFDWGF